VRSMKALCLKFICQPKLPNGLNPTCYQLLSQLCGNYYLNARAAGMCLLKWQVSKMGGADAAFASLCAFYQLFYNLFSNALKFAKEEVALVIKIKSSTSTKDEILLKG